MSENILDDKKRFEVRMMKAKNGVFEKAIFIDGEKLDWAIDMSSYADALKMGPIYQREIQKSIENHFVSSCADFLGRKVTINEIKEAIKTGWI